MAVWTGPTSVLVGCVLATLVKEGWVDTTAEAEVSWTLDAVDRTGPAVGTGWDTPVVFGATEAAGT